MWKIFFAFSSFSSRCLNHFSLGSRVRPRRRVLGEGVKVIPFTLMKGLSEDIDFFEKTIRIVFKALISSFSLARESWTRMTMACRFLVAIIGSLFWAENVRSSAKASMDELKGNWSLMVSSIRTFHKDGERRLPWGHPMLGFTETFVCPDVRVSVLSDRKLWINLTR